MNAFHGWRTMLVMVGLTMFPYNSFAEEEIEVVLDGLKNPCGIAVQPGTGTIFVSESAAGRVIRVVNGQAEEVISGSNLDVYGKGPKYDIGPLGIAFLDNSRLAVADGGYADGEEFVRVFNIPEVGAGPVSYGDGVKVGPVTATEEIKAEGNFYGIAATDEAIFVTANGDDTKGWVAKADIDGTQFGALERFIATKEATDPPTDAPVGITISPRGEVVIGQMGEITVENDAKLNFYNAQNGSVILDRDTGLHDITALAYSPKGHLYALDFAWLDTSQGGLFRLDDDKNDGIHAVKIVGLEKPTCLAFGEDGSLYITLIGEVEGENQVGNGQLIRLKTGL
ncbi:MAG: hypothetical protein MK179_17630 [Pirellulaceae bacterium]|nr:hypothetical protein [Pirellulaceae bacterium]